MFRTRLKKERIVKKNVVLLLGLLALFVSLNAGAQTKVSGTMTCTKADPTYKV